MNIESTQYANHYGYSDATPYEIVRRVSDKTIEIRAMKAERNPDWKMEFVPGGFCGTVINQHSQKWVITSDESAEVFRIRRRKYGWKDKYGNRYQLSEKPVKFYDFNF
jgi:hypothetical protein